MAGETERINNYEQGYLAPQAGRARMHAIVTDRFAPYKGNFQRVRPRLRCTTGVVRSTLR